MKLLLDTQIWLWSFLEPDRLSPRIQEALQLPGNELWLSAVTPWEVLILAERERLRLEPSAGEWIRDVLDAVPMRDAPVTRAIAMESRSLKLSTNDPADRFIAATARVHGLVLVTADRRLRTVAGVTVLHNRDR